MNRFARQENIVGWDQSGLAEGVVMVLGRGWLGTFLVWGLCSLGVGKILWFGRPRPSTQRMAEWFLQEPTPFDGCEVHEFPADPAYESSLAWAAEGCSGKHVLIDCSEDLRILEVSHHFSYRRVNMHWFAGGVSEGGWLTSEPAALSSQEAGVNGYEPIIALAVAALVADAVRVTLSSLPHDALLTDGRLGWKFPPGAATGASQGAAVLVGVGGIGVYAALLLAACGNGALLVDFDHVEESNLNRQGLFTLADTVKRRDKAVAARDAIRRFFPTAHVQSSVQRVDQGFGATLQALRPGPAALLSAVDNARTRVLLQEFGAEMSLPVVHGGTDVFSADCFTQALGGPLLDEQMHGALSESARREGHAVKRDRGCAADQSYVVPGMIAGAMLARRFSQLPLLSQGFRSPPPIRWRQGTLPCEGGNIDEHIDLEGFC